MIVALTNCPPKLVLLPFSCEIACYFVAFEGSSYLQLKSHIYLVESSNLGRNYANGLEGTLKLIIDASIDCESKVRVRVFFCFG